MNEALLSSKKLDWCTPADFFAELDQEFHFNLDPAATDKSAKCARYFTPADDGLKESWGGILRVLQSSIWTQYRRVGEKGLRGKPEARHRRGYAHTVQNGHLIFPRLHTARESRRDPLPAGAAQIYRRGRKREGLRALPLCRRYLAQQRHGPEPPGHGAGSH